MYRTGKTAPKAGEPHDSLIALVMVGAAAALAGSLAHEVFGHVAASLLSGGRVTLLTFLVFRCDHCGAIASAGGPIGAFTFGAAALGLVYFLRPKTSAFHLFLIVFGAIALFWTFGQLIREAIDLSDDWGYVARALAWPSWWRAVAILSGLIGYWTSLRIIMILARPVGAGRAHRIVIPYIFAGIFAILLASLWSGDRVASALDAFQTFLIAPFGLLLVARTIARDKNSNNPPFPTGTIRCSWVCMIAITLAIFIYALTIARGVGPLS